MKCKDSFVIDYPERFDNKHRHGTLELISDVDFEPDWKKILKGEVLENPLSDKYQKLEKGDVIYFHYLIAEEEYMHEDKLMVPCESVFCYVRNGDIFPYGEYVLTEPAYPEESEAIEVDGKTIQAIVGKSGLVEKVDIQYDKRVTRVVYSQSKFEVEPKDMVIMTSHSDQSYDIEGRNLFPIPYEEIVGKLH
jgi:hypothetical protein